MITLDPTGSLFDSDAEALVNTVNCIGVMGKGLAKEFKKRWPLMDQAYRAACRVSQVKIGRMWTWNTFGHRHPSERNAPPYWIICFPTKVHWRDPSYYEFISEGLHDLVNVIRSLKLKSIAIPALGCGYGGLDWSKVYPMIRDALLNLPLDIKVYPPK